MNRPFEMPTDRKELHAFWKKLGRENGFVREPEQRHPEHQYLDLLRDVLDNGVLRDDRTGTGTLGVFGRQIRFDLADGFPLLTTKKVHLRSIIAEVIWFLRGETNIASLKADGCNIWDEWADENGDLGPVYGKQWRSWEYARRFVVHGQAGVEGGLIDQIQKVVQSLILNPNSRRHIVTAWNPADVDDMALPPCHCLFQFHVAGGRLNCQLYQRSADLFLGVPFNIASYALLTMMVAQATGLKPGEFVHSFGDAHLYTNHLDQAEEQLSRTPRPFPTMTINPERRSLDLHRMGEWSLDDFTLTGYDPHPAIKAEVSV